jgi:hypothetical protein
VALVSLALSFALAAAAPQGVPRGKGAGPRADAPLPTLEAAFAYDLSTPNGRVPLNWPSLAYDRAHDELFVVAEGFVRIFDATGMEVYRFGDDGGLGNILRVAVLDDGELLLLTTLEGRRTYLRCDYRGELIEPVALSGLPKSLANFEPDQLVYRDGKLFFAERGTMRVVVTDSAGAFRHQLQLRELVAGIAAKDGERKPPASMDGFNVDAAGNFLFTMSTMFAAATATSRGKVRVFGTRGSTPGKFNIVGGIDADEEGNLFITDRLRSVVSVWDRDLRHLGDFGYRGDGETNLVTPFEIAVGNGKIFVAQAGKRGVKVFRVRLVPPSAPADGDAPAAPVPRPTGRSSTASEKGLG